MNKNFILFTATIGIAYLALTSYSSGVAASGVNRTGSAGSTANCAPCHGSSSTATTGSISIEDKVSSTLVSKYSPLKTYKVTLKGSNTSMLAKFGFQASATNASNTNTGTITATSASNTAVRTVSGIKIIEHTTAIAGTSGSYTISFDWTAPAAGTGIVTFYGIINAVNGTGSTSGDEPSNGFTATLTENTTSISEQNLSIANNVYPNPCSNVLNIESVVSVKFTATVYDLSGRQIIAPSQQNSIDVSSLSAGIYILNLNTKEGQQMISFVKQ